MKCGVCQVKGHDKTLHLTLHLFPKTSQQRGTNPHMTVHLKKDVRDVVQQHDEHTDAGEVDVVGVGHQACAQQAGRYTDGSKAWGIPSR